MTTKQKLVIKDYDATITKEYWMDWFYYVDTEKASYRSHDLTRCLNLWKNANDTSIVEAVGKLG